MTADLTREQIEHCRHRILTGAKAESPTGRALINDLCDMALRSLDAPPSAMGTKPRAYIEHHKGGDNLVWEPIKRGTEIGYTALYDEGTIAAYRKTASVLVRALDKATSSAPAESQRAELVEERINAAFATWFDGFSSVGGELGEQRRLYRDIAHQAWKGCAQVAADRTAAPQSAPPEEEPKNG